MTILKLDFDTRLTKPKRVALRNRVAFVSKVTGICLMYSHIEPSRRGHHVFVVSPSDLAPLVIVCLQAVLGSDLKRETFNLQRALILGKAPTFWHSRWNVMYSEKLRGTADES